MSTALTFTGLAAVPNRTRFVIVNHRVLRSNTSCALCCKRIEQGYLRELQTGLVYCNQQCFCAQQTMGSFAIEDRTKKAS